MQMAALYIRVSTEDQTEFSPDAQKRLLLEYAKKNDLIVSNQYVFIDEGISGRKAEKRPAFMKMIATAKKKPKPYDVILVHKFDRFSRSREDSIVYKSLLKRECDIKVVSITEQLEDDKFSVILEAMLEAMAEYYSLNLADEVTKGMTEKALRGGYQASPPLGYKILHAGELPVIIPEEAEIVKTIFSKYVYEKLTPFQIARYLNSFELKTKLNKNFERRGIEYIIQNPTYKGYVRWNRTHNATNTIKDESEWIIEKGEYEPIISEELFESAHERYYREYNPSKKARPTTEYHHWLSGLIKCSNCGRSLSASTRKGLQYAYFQCNGYTKGKCSVSHSISDKILTPVLLSTIKEIILTGSFEYEVIHNIEKTDTTIFELQLNKLSIKEERIKNAYVDGVDTLDEYKHNKEILLKEKNILVDQINDEKNSCNKDDKKDMSKNIKNISTLITNDRITTAEKNVAIKSIIQKVIYNKAEEMLDVYFYYNL